MPTLPSPWPPVSGLLQAPQAGGLGLGAQGGQGCGSDILVLVPGAPVGLDGQDLALDEGRDAGAILLDAGREREVHGRIPRAVEL
jgi:hypothetical protein